MIISIFFFLLFSFSFSLEDDDYPPKCNGIQTTNKTECFIAGLNKENANLLGKSPSPDFALLKLQMPLDNGRCCWNSLRNVCEFHEIRSRGHLLNLNSSGIDCGTHLEKGCNDLKPKNIDDKSTCHSPFMEPPYECCFVRYRYHAECLAIDTHDKEIYEQTALQLKAARGWKDEAKIEIICGSNFIGIKAIVSLIFIILLL